VGDGSLCQEHRLQPHGRHQNLTMQLPWLTKENLDNAVIGTWWLISAISLALQRWEGDCVCMVDLSKCSKVYDSFYHFFIHSSHAAQSRGSDALQQTLYDSCPPCLVLSHTRHMKDLGMLGLPWCISSMIRSTSPCCLPLQDVQTMPAWVGCLVYDHFPPPGLT